MEAALLAVKEAVDSQVAGRESISSDEVAETRPLEDSFKLRWKLLAIGAALTAIAAISGLVLVLVVKGADGLAAVALSIAILAFLIQIVVFIAQASTATAMMLRSETINTQTSALLTEVQATLRAMQTLVNDQFNYVLRQIIPEVVKETTEREEGQPDEAALTKGLEERLTRSLSQGFEGFRTSAWPTSRPSSGSSDLEAIRTLTTLPKDEALTTSTKILSPLSSKALRMLRHYGNREITQRSKGQTPSLRGNESSDATRSELLRLGLLGKVAANEAGEYYALTPIGREAARILTAVEPLRANDEVSKLRKKAAN